MLGEVDDRFPLPSPVADPGPARTPRDAPASPGASACAGRLGAEMNRNQVPLAATALVLLLLALLLLLSL